MKTIDLSQPLSEVAFPAAPWRVRGQAWAGLFRTELPVAVPAGLQPLIGRRWLVVALVRYLVGPLHYDELFIGLPVRYERRIGVWIDRIWVDDLSSLWGGRRIWGLPKELARFDWHGDTVSVVDATGPIATLQLDRRMNWLLPLPAVVFGVGRLGQRWALTPARGWAWPHRAGLHITEWSPRLPYRPHATPICAIAANPFIATIGSPLILD